MHGTAVKKIILTVFENRVLRRIEFLRIGFLGE